MIDAELQGQFAELINYMIETFKAVGQELPMVAQDLIMAGLVKFTGMGIAGLLFILGLIVVHRVCATQPFEKDSNRVLAQGWCIGFGFVSFLVSTYGFAMAARVYLAPRWYILEYLRTVIK